MSTVLATPVLIGVDVVDTDRIADLIARYGPAAVRRVCTQQEADWVGETAEPVAAERLAVVFALKESAIKAMAGRPPAFRWQSLQTRIRPPSAVPLEVATLMGDFVQDLGSELAVTTGCQVAGGTAVRLSGRLSGPGHVLGAGRYVTQDGHVLATMCFWNDPKAMGGE